MIYHRLSFHGDEHECSPDHVELAGVSREEGVDRRPGLVRSAAVVVERNNAARAKQAKRKDCIGENIRPAVAAWVWRGTSSYRGAPVVARRSAHRRCR